jgi:hypothetical protein
MIKRITIVLLAALFLGQPSLAQELPSYYPADGFQRVGMLDDVQLQRQVIVVNDIPYTLANNTVVHSTSSYSVPMSELIAGQQIGYKMSSSGRLITEIWLLPRNYKGSRRR